MRPNWPRLLWIGLLFGKLWVDDRTFQKPGPADRVARRALLRFEEFRTRPGAPADPEYWDTNSMRAGWQIEFGGELGWFMNARDGRDPAFARALDEWFQRVQNRWNESDWARPTTNRGLILTDAGYDTIAKEIRAESIWTKLWVGLVSLFGTIFVGVLIALIVKALTG